MDLEVGAYAHVAQVRFFLPWASFLMLFWSVCGGVCIYFSGVFDQIVVVYMHVYFTLIWSDSGGTSYN